MKKKKKKCCLRRAQPSVCPSFVQHPFDTAAVDAAAVVIESKGAVVLSSTLLLSSFIRSTLLLLTSVSIVSRSRRRVERGDCGGGEQANQA